MNVSYSSSTIISSVYSSMPKETLASIDSVTDNVSVAGQFIAPPSWLSVGSCANDETEGCNLTAMYQHR